ncbi:MAG: hypothetical protein ACR2M5_05160 [Nakamurella sp.]
MAGTQLLVAVVAVIASGPVTLRVPVAVARIKFRRSMPSGSSMMCGLVAAVPKEIEEAAYVDGASRWRESFSVLLPLVVPGRCHEPCSRS